jgi:hypothetical protein
MSAVLICFVMTGLLITNAIGAVSVTTSTHVLTLQQETPGAPKSDNSAGASEFDRLRIEGFSAVYNIDYKTARERFLQMTRLAPDHPAGYVYLANNIWLETLYQSRRYTPANRSIPRTRTKTKSIPSVIGISMITSDRR